MRKGFTIAEIVIVLGLVSILSGLLIAILVQGKRIFDQNKAQTELQLEARSATDEITRNIRLSTRALSTYNSGTDTYTASSQALILELFAIQNDGSQIPNTFDYVIYFLDSTDSTLLTEVTVANSASNRKSDTKVLARNVSNFQLSYFDQSGNPLTSSYENSTRVKVELSVSKTVKNRGVTATFADQARLRNK